MKILFSYPTELKNEISLINDEMGSENWDLFHLRKPKWTEEERNDFYELLDDNVKEKTVFHQSKGSCHSFEDVNKFNEFVTPSGVEGLDYCFLSPIYDSISKEGYRSKFGKKELREFLEKERTTKVIALGGITEENYNEVIDLGFDGGAFLGSVWKKYE